VYYKSGIVPVAIFSSSFLYFLLFRFVKLAFAAVLVEIEFALSVLIAYLLILHAFEVSEASELFFY
jgi:hypothetical protein